MRIGPIALAAFGLVVVLAVGFLNTHTDELLVVVPCVMLLSGVFGFVRSRRAWLGAVLVGGAVPASQLLALALSWHVPYPNDLSVVATSCIVLVPSLLAAYVGASVHRIVFDVDGPTSIG